MATTFEFTSPTEPRADGPHDILIFIDGTGNDETDVEDDESDITNVLKLHNLVDTNDGRQEVYYHRGIGNESDNKGVREWFRKATGHGGRRIRNQAYVSLITRYHPGDRVFIFGFSRGAALARALASTIQEKGIPERIEIKGEENVEQSVSAGKFESVHSYSNSGTKHAIAIEVMGIWDTVAAFGIPVNLGFFKFQSINLGWDFKVPPCVKQTYHLLAIDESRDAFVPTLTNKADNIEEIWFAGVHSDIGGGYRKRGLGDITLRYMVNCVGTHGVGFKQGELDQIQPDILGALHIHKRKLLKGFKLSPRKIEVLENDKPGSLSPKLHHTVVDRMDTLGNEYQPKPVEKLDKKWVRIDD